MTFSVDRRGRIREYQVASLPIERHRHTLEHKVQSGAEEPEDGVDEIDPPENSEPVLVDEEYTTVEE